MPLGPFDLRGEPFLILYGTLFVLTMIAGFAIPRWLRPEGRPGRITGADDLAFLAGGAGRVIDATVARMLAAGTLFLTSKTGFGGDRTAANLTQAERLVVNLSTPILWTTIATTLDPLTGPVERRLTENGLLIDTATARQLRWWQTAPYLLLLVFGAIKWVVGDLRHKPVEILTFLLIVTAIAAWVRFRTIDRRTQAGMAILADERRCQDRLRRAPRREETDLAVALYGTAVLIGSPLGDFHSLRASSSSSDSGSSGGDSGGGGGCGGGGCGGCGGS